MHTIGPPNKGGREGVGKRIVGRWKWRKGPDRGRVGGWSGRATQVRGAAPRRQRPWEGMVGRRGGNGRFLGGSACPTEARGVRGGK